MIITSLTIAFIVVAGLSMTFLAMRLVEQHGQPSMSSPDLVRPIMIVDADDPSGLSHQNIPAVAPHLGVPQLDVGGIGYCGRDAVREGLCQLLPPLLVVNRYSQESDQVHAA